MKRKTLSTRRLILRPYRLSDYRRWFQAYTEGLPAQNKYDINPKSARDCSLSAFKKILKRHERLANRDECYIYGAFLRTTGQLVGTTDIFVMIRDHYQMANLGYRVFNRHWGHGLGKEIATSGLRIGFEHLKLNRLEAAINLDNPRSLSLARAIGMRREGVKKKYIFENGKWTDNVIFSANPEDLGIKAVKPI